MKRSSNSLLLAALMAPLLCAVWIGAAPTNVFLRAMMTSAEYNQRLFPIYKIKEDAGLKIDRINTQLPSILVYNPAGDLIYYGKEASQNAVFLRHFPDSAGGLKKTDGLFLREDIFQEVPEFAKAKSAILSNHHYLVFALTRSPFHVSCAPQDAAIKELAQKGSTLKVDILELALDVRK